MAAAGPRSIRAEDGFSYPRGFCCGRSPVPLPVLRDMGRKNQRVSPHLMTCVACQRGECDKCVDIALLKADREPVCTCRRDACTWKVWSEDEDEWW